MDHEGDDVLRSVIVDEYDSQSLTLFWLTFVSSVLSASLGMTKCLKVGVAAPMGEDGPLDGMLSGRFVIGFFANAATLVYKSFLIGLANSGDSNWMTALTIIILFLPNLLIAIFTTVGRNNYRALIQHPSLLLLPTFTFFSYQMLKSGARCCGEADGKIMFSKKMSMCNMRVNVVSLFIFGLFSLKVWFIGFLLPIA